MSASHLRNSYQGVILFSVIFANPRPVSSRNQERPPVGVSRMRTGSPFALLSVLRKLIPFLGKKKLWMAPSPVAIPLRTLVLPHPFVPNSTVSAGSGSSSRPSMAR